MRHGFTLIELMIVIAIIAIIAAIAIPNLLESRITSNESAAASSLKAGIFPAQVQFQAGGFLDGNTDGVGDFATGYAMMSGAPITPPSASAAISLSFLPTTWESALPNIGNYLFNVGSNNQFNFCANCNPADAGDKIGRRRFAINAGGTVYATAPSATNTAEAPSVPFGTGYSVPISTYSVYKR